MYLINIFNNDLSYRLKIACHKNNECFQQKIGKDKLQYAAAADFCAQDNTQMYS
jgi:hypothetical protein